MARQKLSHIFTKIVFKPLRTNLFKVNDSTKKDSLKKPNKAILEGKVKRKAVDYEKIDQKKKLLTLYNKAELYYQDIELKSGIIVLDYEKNEVYAGRIKDSTGKYTQLPVFKQGSNVIEPDSIRFNFKTKKDGAASSIFENIQLTLDGTGTEFFKNINQCKIHFGGKIHLV